MTNPQRFLNRVLVFLLLTAGVAGALHTVIWRSFTHNPALNGLILGMLLVGIAYNIRRILLLKPEARWIEAFRTNQPGLSLQDPPQIIAPVASVLTTRDRRGRQSLSALSLRYLLDSISSRLDESRDIARYFTGLLIFLGLLGTFWGLLTTMATIGDIIGSLRLSGDLVAIFEDMKRGLAAPLQGMGTAFSASLFGLAGSLVLGFLDLQATQAQNAFYNDLEEWLSSLTRLGAIEGSGLGEPGGGPALPSYVQAMLQQTGENLERLERSVSRAEEGRGRLDATLAALVQHMGALGDRLGREQELLQRLAQSQEMIAERLTRRIEGPAVSQALDEATRGHIRNTDLQLARLVEELGRGRDEMTRELRGEIKLVARTIALAAGEPQAIRD
ncbi:MAG TPA: flagellar motor protein MotA [Geminicoccaceae bacterium]|nr:flagellar motor protein MotA [Geminicoccus sp.]HMU50716.1 flagellar motor protein MotA [Geminicoccaceae bacterium]